MMYDQDPSKSAPSAFFSQFSGQQSQMQPHFVANIPDHTRRSSRVVKPAIRNISPQNSIRRRLNSLSQAPKRTRSVVDRRTTLPQWQAPYPHLQNRPTSWHTSSYDPPITSDLLTQQSTFGYLNQPFTTTSVNGVFTPLSRPVLDEPFIYDMVTPLEQLPLNPFDQNYMYWHEANQATFGQGMYWLQQNQKTYADQNASATAYVTEYNTMYDDFQHANINTAPASPTFLPI